MSKLTTLKIGGPADYFVEVKTPSQLVDALRFAGNKKINYLVIGGGSNLLVSDYGFNGLVIKINISGIKQADSNTLGVKAGTKLQSLVDSTIKKGFCGINKMTGIPGTVGGAVYGNAGAYGQSISDYLEKVSCFDGKNLTIFKKQQCGFSYRESVFKKNRLIILQVIFKFPKGNKKTLLTESKKVAALRLKKYHTNLKCPGSFFKNIVSVDLSKNLLRKIPQENIIFGKIPAGVLLEKVGAKGDRLGNIEIASYHANLFINKGGGKASDFYNLAKKYYRKVKKKFGIELEPEVQLINLPSLH